MTIADEIQALSNDRTAIQNAILAKGGTVASADGFDDFASAIATIPSGLSGVTGSFTTQSSAGVQNISIPYTGSGYPVSIQFVIDGGAWGKSSFSVGEIQILSVTKEMPLVTPSYRGSITLDGALWATLYARDAYGLKGYQYGDSPVYSTSKPKSTEPFQIPGKTSIKIYVSASGTTGFLANQKYNYTILYSE